MKDVIYTDLRKSYYDPKRHKIFLDKRLLENKEIHDLILKHELEHYHAKKNYVKQFWIDFKGMIKEIYDKDERKISKYLMKNKTSKEILLSISPIKKYDSGYDYDLFTTVFWFFYTFIMTFLLLNAFL